MRLTGRTGRGSGIGDRGSGIGDRGSGIKTACCSRAVKMV
jgi:hypothetical protein